MVKSLKDRSNLFLTRLQGEVKYPFLSAWRYRGCTISLDERDSRYYHALAGVSNGLLSLSLAMLAIDRYLDDLDVSKAESRGVGVLPIYPLDEVCWSGGWIYRGLSIRHCRRTGLYVTVLGLFPSLGSAIVGVNLYHANHGRGYVSRETSLTHD